MMWLAKTSVSDGIAVVIFATVIFLILVGLVRFARWLVRLITGTPKRTETEALTIVLERGLDDSEEMPQEIRKFGWYLHGKLLEAKAGYLADIILEEDEWHLRFEGPDSDQIRELLNADIGSRSPRKPRCVTLERSKKNGGPQIFDHLHWQPDENFDFQTVSEPLIPDKWFRLLRWGRLFTTAGFIGLFVWRIIRMSQGQTENEFSATLVGITLAYLVGALIVSGLTLGLICNVRIKAIKKAAGLPVEDSPISTTLKYVLLMVIGIFGLVFILITS